MSSLAPTVQVSSKRGSAPTAPDSSAPSPRLPSLDTAQRSLETSEGDACVLGYETYGAIDHHDGFTPSLPAEQRFRHSGWQAPRRRIYAALKRAGVSCRRLQHFADCGSALWVNRDGTVLSLACNCCHDRLCLPCQKQRQTDLVEGITLKMLDSTAPVRFVTLTLRHNESALVTQLDRLTSSLKLLRSHPTLKGKMAGGAYFIEVKLDKARHLWHPHLHVIVAGEFIDQRTLAKAWLDVTGDSYIVDIRAIHNARERASYVTKYATKPLHNEVTLVPAKLDEFIQAIKGKRLYQCFGSWMNAHTKDESPARRLERVGRVSSIHEDACAGDIQALIIIHQLHASYPRLRKLFPLPPALAPPATPSP